MLNLGGPSLLRMQGVHIEARTGAGWRPIVHNISLEVRPGEMVGLIGESGAGKTSFGLAALGYRRSGCRFVAGEVLFGGKNLLQMSRSELSEIRGKRIAYVAQSGATAFNPARRILAQHVELARVHGGMSRTECEKRAVDLYARLDLPYPERIGLRYPHQLSGGQLQRAMLAMAMACRPDLIVFDEPTTALDVRSQMGVLGAIKAMREDTGSAGIYISHDLAVVAQLADRIVVLRGGEVIEEGSAEQILEEPKETYTRALIGASMVQGPDRKLAERTLVAINSIQVGYSRQIPVLNNVSFDIVRGSTLAVVGESGSGKTTLARVLSGLLDYASGEILFDGSALPSNPRKRDRETRRRIQLVSQSPDASLNPLHSVRLTIGRPLVFFHDISGQARERKIAELMNMVGLDFALLDMKTAALSGGQKQRLCIARALAAKPDLLVCDEVTSALDPIIASEILKLLIRLQKKMRLTCLVVTHDMAVVRAIADHVLVMRDGRIVEAAKKAALFAHPAHDYTHELICAVPSRDRSWLDAALAAGRGERCISSQNA